MVYTYSLMKNTELMCKTRAYIRKSLFYNRIVKYYTGKKWSNSRVELFMVGINKKYKYQRNNS